MEKPSFKSSPWIRGAPHRVFSRDIRRTRWRISLDTGGRPGFLRRDFHVQKSLNPLRCQPMTVSGLTITRAWRQPGHRQDRMTQKTLSAFRSDGRGLFRFRTATCCRRARISVWSAARSAKISMILCMPERVSGGDAKFQGFCDRWNKWEGQANGRAYQPRPSALPRTTARRLFKYIIPKLTPAANAMADMYPLAATLVLRSMIDFALTNSHSSRYKHAARHLMECSSLASAIDDFGAYEAHDAYEARLGREHGRNIRGDAVGEFLQIERAGVGDVLGARGRAMAS